MNEANKPKPPTKFFPPPTLPTELVDHFSIMGESYKSQEISALMRLYESIDHPTSTKILSLLSATILFRSRTKPEFRESRKSKNQQEQLATLNDIGIALTNAQSELASENTIDGSKYIFATAINYCIASINKRLADLKSSHDEIYNLYLTQENKLQPLITSKQNGPSL